MEPVRLRVVFDDAGILSGSQRRRGLQKCWLQLRPDITTIADLAAQLHQSFGLHRSCPHGLVISMDDFVLPPFESTCILKDEDIIRINKNGVIFKDAVKFCASQNQEQVPQNRETLAFNNRNLAAMDPLIDSRVENDMALCNGSVVHKETPPSEKMYSQCKRKRSNKLQGPDSTLDIKDSYGDSPGDEEDIDHGTIVHKETTSNGKVIAKCKKKLSNEIQFSDSTLSNKDSQADSQGDKGHFTLPIPHKETSSGELIQAKKRKKNIDKLQGLDDTLALGDSQKNSQGDEQDADLHVNIAHKEATSLKVMNTKNKRKYLILQDSDSNLTSKNSQGDSQRDEHFGQPNGDKLYTKIPSCKIKNSKGRKKHSNRHQGSDDVLAIKDSLGDLQENRDDAGVYENKVHDETKINEMMNTKRKKKHFNKQRASDNTLEIADCQGDASGVEDLDLSIGNVAPTINPCEKTNVIKRLKESNDVLAIKDSLGDSQRNRDDDGVYENKVHNETTINEMKNTKRKKKHFNKHRASDNTLAIANCQGDASGVEDLDLSIGNVAPTKTPSEKTNVIKRLKESENEYKGNDDGHASKNDANGEARKVQSRSARRKKARKIWYRTQGYKKKEEPLEHANADQNSCMEKGIASPVIVRTGHIRFEYSDEGSVQVDELVETLKWNGTTSKKKGQKWGMEKSYNKWNDDTSNHLCNEESYAKEAEVVEVSNEKSAVEEVEACKDSISEEVEQGTKCNENSMAKDLKAVNQLIDYESFLPLVRLPEEGDVLVYRVVELSSSWCPELSPFRIGRVSSYDSICSKVVLLPLPEYPFVSEEMSEEGQESCSLYKEDGTLEIDFTYLVDVRLFKAPESEETTPNTPIEKKQKAAPVNNQESEGCSDHAGAEPQYSEGWEAINWAINEKKAQLQKQNNFNQKNSLGSTTTTGPWSYKALRRNALGPTLAMLRSSNGDIDIKASEGAKAIVDHAG